MQSKARFDDKKVENVQTEKSIIWYCYWNV